MADIKPDVSDTGVIKDDSWIQCVEWDEENQDEAVDKLVELRLLIANTQVFKDFNNDRDWKTLTLEPLRLSDVNVPAVANASKLCTSFNVDFKPNTSGAGYTEVTGSAKMVFRKRLDLEKSLPMMKALTSSIQVQHIEDQSTLYPTGDKKSNTKEYFKMKAALAEHRFEIRNDASTLFTNSVIETTTEARLYELFPLANSIVISKQPFCHAYIQFDDEEKQKQMLEIMRKQSPPSDFPVIHLTALCNARRAFGIHRFNTAEERKQEKLEAKKANAQQQGKRPAAGSPSMGNPAAANNAPQQQQQPGASPDLNQLTATLGQLATALGGQQGAGQGVPQAGGIPGQAALGAEVGLSKSQLRRRKMQRKKAEARMLEGGGEMMQGQTSPGLAQGQMMQGQGQMMQNQGQMMQNQGQMQSNPNMNNGLNLVIQTLSTLAQSMSGGSGMGPPMGDQMAYQMGQNGQGPAKKRAKKRRQNNSLSGGDEGQQSQANAQ